MRHHYYNKIQAMVALMLLMLMTGVGCQQAVAQAYGERFSIGDVRFEREKGSQEMSIIYSIIMTPQVGSNELVYLYPELVATDESEQEVVLPPVVVAGSKRAMTLKRHVVYHNDRQLEKYPELAQGIEVIELKEQGSAPIRRSVVLPFEPWMAKAKLQVREQVVGCAACEVAANLYTAAIADLFLFDESSYRYSYLLPEAVAQKSYQEEMVSHVNFRSAQHQLDRDYKSNRAELRSIDSFIQRALSMPGATLQSVVLQGYASPEGGFAYNKALAERRATTLLNYVLSRYPQVVRAPHYEAKGIGEDWEGLRRAVEQDTQVQHKAEILAAIDQYSTDLEREARIRVLGVYQDLLTRLYPPLRRTTITAAFEVRAFTLEELPEVYSENPKLLSHHELMLLAQREVKEGHNPIELYRTAYELFKDDEASGDIARLNYANALLEYERKAAEALAVLQPIEGDQRAVLPQAIAYDLLGNKAKAEELLME